MTTGHLGWADAVFVMEKRHAERLCAKFAEALAGKPVLNLRIPDDDPFNDPALVALLREQLAGYP